MMAGLLLLMAGCLNDPAPQPQVPVSDTVAEAPASTTAPINATEAAAPVADPIGPGFGWAECSSATASLFHKHESVAHLIPAEYRQVNAQAGNVGQTFVLIANCEGSSGGNSTYHGSTSLILLGIQVEAPEHVSMAGANYYLLMLGANNVEFVNEMRLRGVPALELEVSSSQVGKRADGKDDAFELSLVNAVGTPDASTLVARIHWSAEGTNCYVDITRVIEKLTTAEALFRGMRGNSAAVAAPVGVLVGLGSELAENGQAGATTCEGAV